MERPAHYAGKRVTVMGLGRFGGGIGAVRFLADRGARVTVTDAAPADQLVESLRQIAELPLEGLHLGGHEERDFRDAELIVVSPAVLRSHPLLDVARRAGVPLTSEMNLFWKHQRGRIAAVTGSNGKSTTTALLHAILAADGRRVRLGGNIGRSLLPEVDEIEPDDWTVLELSSFQLADLDPLQASPQAAVVTNFSPNHLDWHGTLDGYRSAKQTILRWQTDSDVAVLNDGDPDVRGWPTQGQRLGFGLCDSSGFGCYLAGPDWRLSMDATFRGVCAERRFPLRRWLTLPGRHNIENALAACCAALALGVGIDAVERGVSRFQSLPHRLQFVAEIAGRRFYNDSLATTPESAVAALESFEEPVVLLAGGYDKRVDLAALAAAAATRCRAVALMGQTAERLAGLIASGRTANLPTTQARSFDEAFDWAVGQSRAGDVVLLSPGCASYDWFRNFAHRGEAFVELVRRWTGPGDEWEGPTGALA